MTAAVRGAGRVARRSSSATNAHPRGGEGARVREVGGRVGGGDDLADVERVGGGRGVVNERVDLVVVLVLGEVAHGGGDGGREVQALGDIVEKRRQPGVVLVRRAAAGGRTTQGQTCY